MLSPSMSVCQKSLTAHSNKNKTECELEDPVLTVQLPLKETLQLPYYWERDGHLFLF
jgi:hypothetical protein